MSSPANGLRIVWIATAVALVQFSSGDLHRGIFGAGASHVGFQEKNLRGQQGFQGMMSSLRLNCICEKEFGLSKAYPLTILCYREAGIHSFRPYLVSPPAVHPQSAKKLSLALPSLSSSGVTTISRNVCQNKKDFSPMRRGCSQELLAEYM